MKRSLLAAAGAIITLTVPAGIAGAHNAATCSCPTAPATTWDPTKTRRSSAPATPTRVRFNNLPGQLDLIPGNGDQYGARWAAEHSGTLLPGNCA